MQTPRRLGLAERAAGLGGRILGRKGMLRRLPGPGPVAGWFGKRDLKVPARESFRAWWRRTGGGEAD